MIDMIDINTIRPLNNNVLVSIPSKGVFDNEKHVPGTDKSIIIAPLEHEDNPQEYIKNNLLVEQPPDNLIFNPNNAKSMEWKTTIEIQKGDRVFCSYLAIIEALGHMVDPRAMHEHRPFYIEQAGRLYFFVNYSRLIAKVNGDKLIPLNGLILAKPIGLPQKYSNLQIIKFTKENYKFFSVVAVGSKNEKYVRGNKIIDFDDYYGKEMIAHGSIVCTKPGLHVSVNFCKLQNTEFNNLVYLKRYDIAAVVTDEEFIKEKAVC